MGNARNDDVRSDPQPTVLVPYTLVAPSYRVLAVRTMADPDALGNALRAQVREMDREQASLPQLHSRSLMLRM